MRTETWGRIGRRTRAGRGVGVRCGLRLQIGLLLLEERRRHAPDARGSRLPGIRRLAELAGVHRNTAAAVYRDLVRFGLVDSRRGSGTYTLLRSGRSVGAARPACRSVDLRAVLAAELGVPVRPDDGAPATPLLVPLDEVPPSGRLVVPVAPVGAAWTELRRLAPGDDVVLVSGNQRLGRLLRNVLRAWHNGEVGLERVADRADPGAAGAALVLCDARHAGGSGTTPAPGGLCNMRLVESGGPRTG
ncbi:MAG: GntR family transcriptional regulator [Gemmatimonadales bacterium]